MNGERWERIQILFHEVADLPEGEQLSRLQAACDDETLLSEVIALLKMDARGATLFEKDLAHLAKHSLNGSKTTAVGDFGPYRIKEPLGEGGMGVVYLAERDDLGSLVAIKILRDAWLSPARRERFTIEQKTLAQLIHPSIARLYDADTSADGTPWFAMEYVDGIPLTNYCRDNNCSMEERLRLLRAVCEAVQYAHEQAIIHRDLKPSNILVKKDGSIRLLDFGIAKQLETLDSAADQTKTGLRLMTPAYAAPEQIRGERAGTHTDVYSLGVILYELLTGRLPYDLSNKTPGQAEIAITQEEAEKPSAAAKGTAAQNAASKRAWADLNVLCLTAIHKESGRRYRSAEALLRDIDHYLKEEPLEARGDSWAYRTGKFVVRNRRALSATAAALVMVVGLLLFFTLRLAKARDAALAQTVRTERIEQFMMSLFGGDEDAAPADDLRVVDILERGVQKARLLKGEPAAQSDLYQTLGSSYTSLGKYDRASSLLQLALAERKSVFGLESREVCESDFVLANLRIYQGRFKEAEQLARTAVAICKKNLPSSHASLGQSMTVLGSVLEHRGAYRQAIQVLEAAVQMQSTRPDEKWDLLDSLGYLSNSHTLLGEEKVAEPIARHVLALDRQKYGERHPGVAEDWSNLGSIEEKRGRYAEAERDERRALQIERSWYGVENVEVALVEEILASVLAEQQKYDEASRLLQTALPAMERDAGKNHPYVGFGLNWSGFVAMKQGRFNEAEADFQRMDEIYKSLFGEKDKYAAMGFMRFGELYLAQNQDDRAEQSFRRAVLIYSATLGTNNAQTGAARIELGDALLHEQRYGEAEAQLRPGYEIVTQEGDTSMLPAVEARRDLAAVYAALHEPDKLAKLQAE